MLPLAVIGGGLILLYVLFIVIGSSFWLSVANQAGPVLLLGTCLWGIYHSVKRSHLGLWTPIPWFLAACSAYFGLGPLVYHFGSPESVSYIDTFFQVDEAALTSTNLLNAVGVTAVALGFLFGLLIFRRQISPARQFHFIETRRLMFFFLGIGLFIEFIFVLPNRLGLLSWTLPGAIQHLSSFAKIAIILLFVLVQHGFRGYRWLLYGLIGVEVVMSLMTFSKLAVIEVLIAIGLGWYLGRPSFRALVVSGIAVILLYVFVLSPFVSYGRIAFSAVGVGTVTEVSESVAGYAGVQKEDLASFLPGVQGWWTRLSYSNAQAFAMDAYDRGAEGESLGLLIYAFLPRVLFPEKPLMTPGREFTVEVLGYDSETNTAPGVFAEGYWNGGWIMVVAVCLYIGVLFAGFTAFSLYAMSVRKYEYLPIVMIGLVLGYRPDDWFVATYVGTLANVLVLYLVLRYIVMPLIRVPRVRYSPAVL